MQKRENFDTKKVHSYNRKYKDKIKRDKEELKKKDLPTKYETNILTHSNDIPQWIADGLTIREICTKLDISYNYWYDMIKQHEGLKNLVSIGEHMLCSKAEKSLHDLCTGFYSIDYKTTVEEDTNGKKHVKTEEIKHYNPPSGRAIEFMLRNRLPDKWSDKKELILDTKDNELQRKELFKQMLNSDNDNTINANYTDVTNTDNNE